MIPFADLSSEQDFRSPYYNQSHAALRKEVRKWVEEDIQPFVDDWENAKQVPPTIYSQMGQRGYLAGMMGIKYPAHLAPPGGVSSVAPRDWDLFHELILTDELARTGCAGFVLNLIGGFGISCPPLIKYGNLDLVNRIVPKILAGGHRIVLAITEPDAGSDVAGLACEATRTEDGKYFIVNGGKKWITNGIWADYFMTAVRTGGPGLRGISLLLIERSEGVSTRRMDCQGIWASGTTYVTFEDVKVPVENLIGEENDGFRLAMENFNHERLALIIQCLRLSRVCYAESVKHASTRVTFGKTLIEHSVIRLKFANMVGRIEACHNWLENCVYQYQHMTQKESMAKLGGPIADLKAQATKTFEYCAREASQIFGGLSYTRGGRGGVIERLYRDVRSYAIPGGSEEIMLDFSIRQVMRALDTRRRNKI